jgi:serine/threonine protein kinase
MGLGTPAFMAPEQAGDDPSKITRVADVYALGTILYTALTGRPPFEESSALSTIVKVISDERPPSVCDLRPDVPEELDRICMKCLEKNPTARYPSAWSFAKELRQFHRDLRYAGRQQATTMPTNVRLRLTSTGRLVPITQSTTLFGRSAECDVVLDAAKVSKKHCQILLADKVFVEDLGSSNGTFLNGKRVRRSSLKDGDELTIAGHRFQVLLN